MIMVSFCWKMNVLPNKIKNNSVSLTMFLKLTIKVVALFSGPPCIERNRQKKEECSCVSYFCEFLLSLRPHVWDDLIPAVEEKPLEVLEQGVLVLVQEAVNIIPIQGEQQDVPLPFMCPEHSLWQAKATPHPSSVKALSHLTDLARRSNTGAQIFWFSGIGTGTATQRYHIGRTSARHRQNIGDKISNGRRR